MTLQYANGYRPRGGAKELLKESLKEIKEADERNRKPPKWIWRRTERKEYYLAAKHRDFQIYAEMLGISFFDACCKIFMQAHYLANFLEYDL